jgi:hypothetical protein
MLAIWIILREPTETGKNLRLGSLILVNKIRLKTHIVLDSTEPAYYTGSSIFGIHLNFQLHPTEPVNSKGSCTTASKEILDVQIAMDKMQEK